MTHRYVASCGASRYFRNGRCARANNDRCARTDQKAFAKGSAALGQCICTKWTHMLWGQVPIFLVNKPCARKTCLPRSHLRDRPLAGPPLHVSWSLPLPRRPAPYFAAPAVFVLLHSAPPSHLRPQLLGPPRPELTPSLRALHYISPAISFPFIGPLLFPPHHRFCFSFVSKLE